MQCLYVLSDVPRLRYTDVMEDDDVYWCVVFPRVVRVALLSAMWCLFILFVVACCCLSGVFSQVV